MRVRVGAMGGGQAGTAGAAVSLGAVDRGRVTRCRTNLKGLVRCKRKPGGAARRGRCWAE